MTLEVRATCEEAASIVYEWGNYNYDESLGYATFVPFHTGRTYTFTPQRRDVWVYARATAYDGENEWIGSSDAYFFISSPTDAHIINSTNTLKIDRNGSRQLTIQVANAVGTVYTCWSWRDKTDQDQMFNTSVGEGNGASYTVSNYSNSNIIYFGDVYDDLGYIGTAQFKFEFCTSHTGNWIVVTAPTDHLPKVIQRVKRSERTRPVMS